MDSGISITPRLIIGVLALGIVSAAGITGSLLLLSMVDEVNRKREETPISPIGFHYWKLRMILREYRRLYPDGKLLRYWWIAFAASSAGVLVGAVCFGILA